MFTETATLVFLFLVSLPIFFVVALIIKLQRPQAIGSQREIEDPEALAQAEQIANQINWRQEVMREHSLLDNFATTQGYTEDYMEQLVQFLGSKDVLSTYHFQESIPTGEISVTGRTGMFELYVKRGQELTAQNFIQKFRNPKTHA